MHVTPTHLPDVLILEPRVFADDRGWFCESFNVRTFREATGLDVTFVQDNHSRSKAGVLRGLHCQVDPPQAKLVRCTVGRVFDVVVDIRRSSPTLARWTSIELSADNHRQLWVPAGFAHGFYVLDGPAEVQYKTTDFYHGPGERSIRWDDPTIGIEWPFDGTPFLSDRDAAAPLLTDAGIFE
ncbi:MAG: dTDP-4-dehydrorhamnose 3,5-epimerase [Gammaproteobacteria bacterium]|nr:dTDP-4-dehydrorhamnose 3,5-epimerase [Gammaproteobacteria bacterium]